MAIVPASGGGRGSALRPGRSGSATPAAAAALDNARPRILVVDDSAGARDAMATLLEGEGYEVTTAAGSREALASLEASVPDLVISDIRMDDGDGLSLIAQLREGGVHADLPVILVSASEATRDRIRGLDLGADDYLQKPIDCEELLARIRVHLRRARREHRLQRISHVDELTSAHNRRGLEAFLADPRQRRAQGDRAVMAIDLDGFKEINDTHGHATGDLVLRTVAAALDACLRPDDCLARVGGDEFLIVLGDTTEQEARSVAQRIRALSPIAVEVEASTRIEVGFSLGMAMVPRGQSVDAATRQADTAMYVEKRRGRS